MFGGLAVFVQGLATTIDCLNKSVSVILIRKYLLSLTFHLLAHQHN